MKTSKDDLRTSLAGMADALKDIEQAIEMLKNASIGLRACLVYAEKSCGEITGDTAQPILSELVHRSQEGRPGVIGE